MATLGLPPASYAIDGLEFYGRMSFLKAGLVYADAITTVSPTYAREIQSEAHGSGLDGVLRMRRAALTGILNGIDTARVESGDRSVDRAPLRPAQPGPQARQQAALQRRLGLAADPDVPLLGVVSRFTHQKGTDVLAAAVPELAGLPVQLAALGSGERGHEEAMRSAAARYPGRIAVAVGFDEELAHLIEAGADMFVMPSRFEPCGLNQMYSQRYGTPPIAHATGGLADTIVDCTRRRRWRARTATGFLFDEPAAPALVAAVRRAIDVFREHARAGGSLQQNGMARDFSWRQSAEQYVEVYRRISRRSVTPGLVTRDHAVTRDEAAQPAARSSTVCRRRPAGLDRADGLSSRTGGCRRVARSVYRPVADSTRSKRGSGPWMSLWAAASAASVPTSRQYAGSSCAWTPGT